MSAQGDADALDAHPTMPDHVAEDQSDRLTDDEPDMSGADGEVREHSEGGRRVPTILSTQHMHAGRFGPSS